MNIKSIHKTGEQGQRFIKIITDSGVHIFRSNSISKNEPLTEHEKIIGALVNKLRELDEENFKLKIRG